MLEVEDQFQFQLYKSSSLYLSLNILFLMSVITVLVFFLNIIFVGLLVNSNYEISINKNFYDIILNGIIILHGQLNNSIYIVSRLNIIYISNKYPRIDDITTAYLWHCRLGHINKNRMNGQLKKRFLIKMIMNCYLPVSPTYLKDDQVIFY